MWRRGLELVGKLRISALRMETPGQTVMNKLLLVAALPHYYAPKSQRGRTLASHFPRLIQRPGPQLGLWQLLRPPCLKQFDIPESQEGSSHTTLHAVRVHSYHLRVWAIDDCALCDKDQRVSLDISAWKKQGRWSLRDAESDHHIRTLALEPATGVCSVTATQSRAIGMGSIKPQNDR